MTVKRKEDFIHGITDSSFTRKMRANFSRFMDEQYNLNVQAFYRKLRSERIEQWELQGLLGCIAEFDPSLGPLNHQDVYQWFNQQCDKMRFYEFMNGKGLCRDTIKKHMDDEDWTRLNLIGWNKAWEEFKATTDE